MLLMYVNGAGFVMDFNLSGDKLEFTSVVAQAQQFDTRGQIRHTMLTNDVRIDDRKVFAMEVGEPIVK